MKWLNDDIGAFHFNMFLRSATGQRSSNILLRIADSIGLSRDHSARCTMSSVEAPAEFVGQTTAWSAR
jgi:hypothetical protein